MYEIEGLLATHVAIYIISYVHGKRGTPIV